MDRDIFFKNLGTDNTMEMTGGMSSVVRPLTWCW